MPLPKHGLLALLVFLILSGLRAAPLLPAYDVVVAGAGTGGSGAAIQAARMGASVLLLEETEWIGGQMLAAGVSALDEGGGAFLVRERGLYREFLGAVQEHYRAKGLDPLLQGQVRNMRVEASVGRRILQDLISKAGRGGRLDLSLLSRVTRVHREGDRVTGVDVEIAGPGETVTHRIASRVLIDATEWGDVIPLTGARYRAGNRTSEAIDPSRQIQEHTWTAYIRKYPGGVPEALRIGKEPPGYATMAETFSKSILPGDEPRRIGTPMSTWAFLSYRASPDSALPPGKEITRSNLNYTNDYPCTVADMEDPARRKALGRAMRLRTLQLLYHVQNALGLKDWSVADDEGFDTASNRAEVDEWLREQPELEPYRAILGHFTAMPYVRESRRIIGLHTLLAREISRGPGRKPVQFTDTVALGDYRLDLHGGRGRDDLELDLDRLEDLEDIHPSRSGPFAIPMGCLVPEKIDGFLAAEKNFSQTRLVNGATRMQPHTLNIGQAAGALAALAVRHGVQPRAVDAMLVQRELLAAGAVLAIRPLLDVPRSNPQWEAIHLAVTRGLLALEADRFFPDRPMTKAEISSAVERIAADTVMMRGAPALGTLSGELAAAATRADAAATLARFLELKALAGLSKRPPNVLFIAVDDLGADLGCNVGAAAKTPHLDALARRSVVFQRAYCQFPLCNPSRSSLMTGLRPSTLGIHDLTTHFRWKRPDIVTLPQLFKKAGYASVRIGKIYHYGVPSEIGTPGLDDPASWTLSLNPIGRDKTELETEVTDYTPARPAGQTLTKHLGSAIAWCSDPKGRDEEHTDGMVAEAALRQLEANRERPFFLAVGFYRPHSPYIAPSKYFDLHPLEAIAVDDVKPDYAGSVPRAALASTTPWPRMGTTLEQARKARQAYAAAVSFIDAQIGRLMDALDRLGLRDNTIVVLWGDNGTHLGDHGLWFKQSLFERSARVPLLLSVPGADGNGRECPRTVELLDLYPTLADLCGLKAPAGLEGLSLRPLLLDPGRTWDRAAFSEVWRANGRFMGRSIRTERHRYTEWDGGRQGVELYDLQEDPGEMRNLAADPAFGGLARGLHERLNPR